MIILNADGVGKYYGIDVILNNVSFTLQEGERMGIVGQNGAGKTTLLRLISGVLQADEGHIHISDQVEMDYLRQEGEFKFTGTPYEEMRSTFDNVFKMEKRIREIELLMGEVHDSQPEEYERLSKEYVYLLDRFEESNGYGFESAIMGVLKGLGFAENEIHRPAATLSGGEQARLALGKLLLKKPSLMLLDEPTNHLDIESIAWLEDYLSSYRGSALIVSHDRYFLDSVCNTIGDISFNTLIKYNGNYTQYVKQKAELRRKMQKDYELNQREIRRQEDIIEMYKRFNREKSIKAARSREKALEKIERVERPMDEKTVRFSFETSRRTGEDILRAENLSLDYGDGPLFRDLKLHIRSGDRLAIVGRNGIGKTTLLRILTGSLKPTTGDFLWGTGVEIGYYDQKQEGLTPTKTVFEEVWDAYPLLQPQKIRDTLAAFLFRGDDIEKKISELSGGEKGRVSLIKLLLGKYNLLILDEPTNHLDAESAQVLEDALNDYKGTFIFVSHDRYFINRVATRILEMRDDGITDYDGNWDEYMHHKMMENREDPFAKNDGLTKTERRKQTRIEKELEARQRDQRRAIKKAEDHITELENELARVEEKLSAPLEVEESIRLSQEHARLQAEIDAAMEEWEKLQS